MKPVYISTVIFSAPSGAPSNVYVNNLESNGIMVIWDAVDLQYANGQIQGYIVYYREHKYYYYNYHAESVNTTDPNVLQIVLHGLDAGGRYEIAVSAYTSVGEGPRSPWLQITVGKCYSIE